MVKVWLDANKECVILDVKLKAENLVLLGFFYIFFIRIFDECKV